MRSNTLNVVENDNENGMLINEMGKSYRGHTWAYFCWDFCFAKLTSGDVRSRARFVSD